MAALAARFLGITKSKLKSSPSNPYRILPHSRPLLAADSNRYSRRRPMFLVQHSRDKSRNFSVISPDGSSWRIDDPRSRVFSSLLSIGNSDFRRTDYSLIATCNDLMLLSRSRPGPTPEQLIWNPTTNESKTLPPSSVPISPYEGLINIHICTTSLFGAITTSYGFGFDPAMSRDRCKIVRIFQADCNYESSPDYRAEVYSPETDSWREIPYPFDYCSNEDGKAVQFNSVHVNGCYYWPFWGKQCVLCFNFSDEKFLPRLIPLPEKVDVRRYINSNFRLVEFHGSFAVVVWQGSKVEIWVWNGDEWKWSLASMFDFDPISGDHRVIRLLEYSYHRDNSYIFNHFRMPFMAEMYSLRSNSWTPINCPVYLNPKSNLISDKSCRLNHGVHSNGCYYWVATYSGLDDFVVCFDFCSGKFARDFILLPDFGVRLKEVACDGLMKLVEFCGSLAVVIVLDNSDKTCRSTSCEIWVWNRVGSLWSRALVLDVPAFVQRVVGLFENDKLVVEVFRGDVLVFYCGTGKVEKVRDIYGDWVVNVFEYVESYSPLNKMWEILRDG